MMVIIHAAPSLNQNNSHKGTYNNHEAISTSAGSHPGSLGSMRDSGPDIVAACGHVLSVLLQDGIEAAVLNLDDN